MTQEEKDKELAALFEQQIHLEATMRESDAHASKCQKLGLTFKEQYPEEFATYIAANEQYHINRDRIEELENTEVEPERIKDDAWV